MHMKLFVIYAGAVSVTFGILGFHSRDETAMLVYKAMVKLLRFCIIIESITGIKDFNFLWAHSALWDRK